MKPADGCSQLDGIPQSFLRRERPKRQALRQ
jgi:hypothetical protein